MRIFVGDGSPQERNTQSIKRSFVRWVYFALNRRGLDLSVFRRHVHFRLSHFSLSLSTLTGTCHVPVGIRQGRITNGNPPVLPGCRGTSVLPLHARSRF